MVEVGVNWGFYLGGFFSALGRSSADEGPSLENDLEFWIPSFEGMTVFRHGGSLHRDR